MAEIRHAIPIATLSSGTFGIGIGIGIGIGVFDPVPIPILLFRLRRSILKVTVLVQIRVREDDAVHRALQQIVRPVREQVTDVDEDWG